MVMPTDISPIFGLTLLELAETAVITGALIGIAGSGIVAGVVLLVNWLNLRHQQKISSINVSLKMLEYWEEQRHKVFSTMVELVHNHEVEENNPHIRPYLGIWEDIAVLCNNKTIQEAHVREFFVADLRNMREDGVVYGYLEKKHTDTIYNNLWNLMEKYVEPCDS